MDNFLEILGSRAVDNFLSLGLLFGAVWWFSKRDLEKDKRIDELHAENKKLLKEELEKSRDVISNNTIAFTAFKEAVKR